MKRDNLERALEKAAQIMAGTVTCVGYERDLAIALIKLWQEHGQQSARPEAPRREDAPGSAGNAGSHYDMEPVFKNLQDAPRVLRNTFTIQHEGKRADVVFASFAACIERENNSLRSAPSPQLEKP